MPEHRVDMAGLAEGEARVVDIGGRRVAVAVTVHGPVAFDDTCTHMQCSLTSGDLEDDRVVCPCHGATFHLATGAVISGPAPRPIEVYRARPDGNSVLVDLP